MARYDLNFPFIAIRVTYHSADRFSGKSVANYLLFRVEADNPNNFHHWFDLAYHDIAH